MGYLDQAGSKISAGGRNFDQGLRSSIGMDNSEQKALMKQSRHANEQHYKKQLEEFGRMRNEDIYLKHQNRKELDQYKGIKDYNVREYMGVQDQLRRDAEAQAQDARQTYTNTIQPQLKNAMETARSNASQAMTLSQAGDPNNQIHQAVRGLYDQQAQGVRQQGLADYGVLAALGNQATAGQMGTGAPMTGAQTQLLQSANLGQASLAYNRAQQQMARLKEQGIEKGFQESDRQYQRGTEARDAYNRSIGNFESAMDRNLDREKGFRDTRQAYAADKMGVHLGSARENLGLEQGYAGLEHQLNTGNSQRMLGALSDYYGGYQQGLANQIAGANASNAARAGLFGAGITAAGTIGGAMIGGPAGAAAGAAAGQQLGGAMGQAGQVPYQPVSYGSGGSQYQQQQYPGYGYYR